MQNYSTGASSNVAGDSSNKAPFISNFSQKCIDDYKEKAEMFTRHIRTQTQQKIDLMRSSLPDFEYIKTKISNIMMNS